MRRIQTLRGLFFSVCGVSLLLVMSLSSCQDDADTVVASGSDKDQDMFLRVNVPRAYALGADVTDTKETLITGVDVLVFAPGPDDHTKFYLKSASEGTPVEGGNKFQVTMPVGDNLKIHVFTNCHDMMVAKGAYNQMGMEMNALLSKLVTTIDNNAIASNCLPMHGFLSEVSITKDEAGKTFTVPVLRAVAAVQVVTKAMIGSDHSLIPGDITDSSGKIIFRLRELYTYFPTDSGRVAPIADAYIAETTETKNKTRDVNKVSLAGKAGVRPLGKKYSVVSAEDVKQLGSLYLYENMHYTDNGYDQPGSVPDKPEVATTRLVVGGVYGEDKKTDGTPRVTYYRVDIADPATSKIADLLRNHKYTFNIVSVSGSGYDTPDDAATGVPINIFIKVIDWTNIDNNVDFDRENWFSAETKNIVLPRNAGFERTICIETDVKFDGFWTLSFKTDNNGKVTPVETHTGDTDAMIENDRYKVVVKPTLITDESTKATLTVTAKKDYGDVPVAPASRDEILCIKVKDLRVYIHITQVDRSPDDWGNGGNNEVEVVPKTNDTEVNDVYTTDWEGSGMDIATGGKLN